MKFALSLFLFLFLMGSPGWCTTENPHAEFPARNNFTNSSTITWRYSKNIIAECNRESKLRGLGGFKYAVEACSFWTKVNGKDECTIITDPMPNFHTVGHEIRHCFQGNFHKE